MKKNILIALLFVMTVAPLFSQQDTSKPKLVVGIVVDQMRNDYIYRYWNDYGNGGFRRLVNDGFYFKNAHYNYVPTITGPGHSSIYTGTTPRFHGIIANEWIDKKTGKKIKCVVDTTVKPVGTKTTLGQKSPKNLMSSTIGDELKMSTNKNGKVFSVAIKDRSAILPAGHAADGAFWYDDKSGDFVSSSWYVNDLPQWLKDFNSKKLAKSYLEKGWDKQAGATYSASIEDNNNYEKTPYKKDNTSFPYEYSSFLTKGEFGVIAQTPYGNTITKDVAMACIESEQLGKDNTTDLFCMSFSCTDIIAHDYGPRSMEIEDVYLRLDKDLEEFLNFLDAKVGKNNYVVFLTADHGGADVPRHLLDNKIPAGYLKKSFEKDLEKWLQVKYPTAKGLFLGADDNQIYLSEEKIIKAKLNKDLVEETICKWLLTYDGIAEAYTSKTIMNGGFDNGEYKSLIQNGYNHLLSGNICMVMKPGWMDYADKGTTHGAAYNYDTHIPILFYGKGIKKGFTYGYTTITQIAPTVSELIQINQPNSTIASPLNEFFR